MPEFTESNVSIDAGSNNPVGQPSVKGNALYFNDSSNTFVPPYLNNAFFVRNDGTGVPVFDNQVNLDLHFASIVPGENITISKSNGEIRISAVGGAGNAVTIVNSVEERDSLTGLSTGSQVFVTDTGQGENALYLWNGTSFITISTQDSASTDAQSLTIILNYNSPNTITIGRVSPGSMIVDVCIDVIQEFNGSNPIVSIGDDINGHSVIMNNSFNDLTIVDKYSSESNYLYGGSLETTVNAYYDSIGSTQGQAKITITYV